MCASGICGVLLQAAPRSWPHTHQQKSQPSVSMAHVLYSPASTLTQVFVPTQVGTLKSWLRLPWPTWPLPLSPQQYRLPFVLMAQAADKAVRVLEEMRLTPRDYRQGALSHAAHHVSSQPTAWPSPGLCQYQLAWHRYH